MIKIIGKEIRINRGDRAAIRLKLKNGEFKKGDVIKFSIVDRRNYNIVFFQNEYKVSKTGKYAYILLNEEDTRFAKIDKKLFCKYEIEYNKCLTLVGADDDNENIIIIYAEAGDK